MSFGLRFVLKLIKTPNNSDTKIDPKNHTADMRKENPNIMMHMHPTSTIYLLYEITSTQIWSTRRLRASNTYICQFSPQDSLKDTNTLLKIQATKQPSTIRIILKSKHSDCWHNLKEKKRLLAPS